MGLSARFQNGNVAAWAPADECYTI